MGRDISIMPYQEEPKDLPNTFVIEASPSDLTSNFIPIVIAGSLQGRSDAKAAYDRILASVPELYEKTADYYEAFDRTTLNIRTPDDRIDTAFRWAKIGIDKGLATNPTLGTGLLAGFRTAGESERPGYAWFFGRDALWTTLATTAEGSFETTKRALEFLRTYQRADGKIPHEISQSASLIPWFDQYAYPWASADATPLYVIAHADYWHASGDRTFISTAWPSVAKAYQFSAATDTDGNGLIENTTVGHGWVEGGALYPPHEEMYLQGLWIAASRGIADLADVVHDEALAKTARATAERTRAAMEQTYWIADRGYYAFATARPTTRPREAEPGPQRERRQSRLNALAGAPLVDEDTVLPAVPLWFGTVSDDRAQREVDHLGASSLATDWGDRLLSNQSALYDPLSYHYGSVWPLFTGWASVGAYRYGRPHVGFGALTANVLLTWSNALGYITELLSGDFATPFGRSSHHQIWSEAMVVSPIVKGLLGIDVTDGGRSVRFAPALPASWDRVGITGLRAGPATYAVTLDRSPGRTVIRMNRTGSSTPDRLEQRRLTVAPAFPADTRMQRVTVNGTMIRPELTRIGDELRAQIMVDEAPRVEVVFSYEEGTDIETDPQVPAPGAANEGLRILRSSADGTVLHLVLEGRAGRTYTIRVRSPRRLLPADGVTMGPSRDGLQSLDVRFEGPAETYVRREISVPLSRRLP